ncbi:MAG: SGNH/GDSL hydrolase family protein [Acinetobacter sp.]
MAVPEQMPIVVYTANGTTKNFPITFDLHDQHYLNVFINKELVAIGSYTVENFETVVFTQAPNENDEVTLIRDTQLDRETNYQSYDNSFRPAAVNYDFDKIWHVLQEQNLIDGKLLARLKDEIEWRRTHDFNYDELAQVREKQLFDALKTYTETLVSATNPGIFQGVIAGVVFAQDGKSIQTHLDEILKELEKNRINLSKKADLDYVNLELSKKAPKTYVDAALTSFQNGAIKTYPTLAEANSDIANIELNTKVSVLSETEGGDYYKASSDATSLIKAPYDVLTRSKEYVDSLVPLIRPLYSQENNIDKLYVEASDANGLNGSGAIIEGEVGRMINVFPVEGGKTYSIYSNDFNPLFFAISTRTTNSVVLGATQGKVRLIDTDNPNVKVFSVPETAKFAFINIKILDFDFDISLSIKINKNTSIITAPKADVVLNNDLTSIENILDHSKNVVGGYVDASNQTGSIISYDARRVFSVFPIEGGKTYSIYSNDFNPLVFSIATRQTNSIEFGSTLGKVRLTDTDNPNVKRFTVPSLARFGFINVKILDYNFDITRSLKITKGDVVATSNSFYRIGDADVMDLEARKRIEKLNNNKSTLNGKTWGAYGDSITYWDGYADVLAERHSATLVKKAKPGARVHRDPENTVDIVMSELFDTEYKLDYETDIITIALGTNDVVTTTLGTMSDRTVNTFYGALHVLVLGLRKKWTNARIGFISAVPRTTFRIIEGGTDQASLKQKAVRDVCGFYSIPLWEGYKEFGFHPDDSPEFVKYMHDGIHFTELGGKWYANRVEDFILNLAK